MKCLITKLDAVVDDNTLPSLTGMIATVNTIGFAGRKREISLFSNPNVFENGTITVKTLDGSNMLSTSSDFSNPTNEITFSNFYPSTFKFLYLLEGEFKLYITTTNISGITLVDGGSEIPHPVSFNIDVFKYTNLERLTANYAGGVTGLIENLPSSMTTISLMSTNVTGNIVSLGKCLSLSSLRVYRTSGLTGDIADLAQAMFDNGRISGSMSATVYGSSITVNGEGITSGSKTVTFSSSGYTIS